MRIFFILPLLILLIACGNTNPDAPESNYRAIVAQSTSIPGFVPMYWHEEQGKLYIEIERFDTPLIYINSLSRGIGSNDLGLDRGQLGETHLVSFQRRGPKVLFIADNPKFIANSDNPEERASVEQAFATSVLWGFEVAAEEDDRVLVDGSAFFLRDAHGVAATLKEAEEGAYEVDVSRSSIYLPRTKGFPDNTEVDATVTLIGESSGQLLPTVAPDAGAITVHQHHSFVRLPDDDYQPLTFDPRSGFIDLYDNDLAYDYASEIEDPLKNAYAWRHRLEKVDPTAATSEAVEPIVYYLDRGAPEPIRSALIEGALWWNQAFEAAGYKDAFQVKMLPEGADPMDVRYNVIQWVHRSTRGWSYGYSVRDPRTQEILKGHVSLGSLRVRQDYLLAEGFLAPYGKEDKRAAAQEFSLARIRQLSAHEVGHTLGLEHNFAGSTNNRASVMDYPFPYVTLTKDGNIDVSQAYASGIGEWDKRAILWGYQDFPEEVDRESARQDIIRDTLSMGLSYVADRHSRGDSYAVNAGPSSPRGSLWDNGADPVEELDRLMTVRASVLQQFSQNNLREGRPLANLEDIFVPMYLIHRFQLQAAATVVGGRDFTYAIKGDKQNPTAAVSAVHQRRAINSMLATVTPSALRIKPELVAMIPPRPPGSGHSRELFPRQTGYLFDPTAAAAAAAGLTFDMLLDPTRAARMNNNHDSDPSQPGFQELLTEIMRASFYRQNVMQDDAALQRVVNMEVLHRMMRLAGDPTVQTHVRAQTYDQLLELKEWLSTEEAAGPTAETSADWRAHKRFAGELIRRFRDNPQAIAPLKPLEAPPGSPI